MDSKGINQNFFTGGITPGQFKPLEQKTSAGKPQEIVTDWQLPQDQTDITSGAPAKKEKPAEKTVKPEAKPVTEDKPGINHQKMMVVDGQILQADQIKPLIGTSNMSAPSALFIEEPMNLPHPGGEEFVVPWQLPSPDGLKEVGPTRLTAGKDTAFFATGLNSIGSIARDGIFNLDGEKLNP